MNEIATYTPFQLSFHIILPAWATVPQAEEFKGKVSRHLDSNDIYTRKCETHLTDTNGDPRMELVVITEFCHQQQMIGFAMDVELEREKFWEGVEPRDARAKREANEEQVRQQIETAFGAAEAAVDQAASLAHARAVAGSDGVPPWPGNG